MKTLVIVAHPSYEESRVNRKSVEELSGGFRTISSKNEEKKRKILAQKPC